MQIYLYTLESDHARFTNNKVYTLSTTQLCILSLGLSTVCVCVYIYIHDCINNVIYMDKNILVHNYYAYI